MSKYLTAVIEFKYNGNIHNALVFQTTNEGKLLCYRLVRKTKQTDKYFPVLMSDGTNSKYQVQFACRFILPSESYKKILFYCHPDTLKEAARRYNELPPLAELIVERKNLFGKLKSAPSEERKAIQNKLNQINMMINDKSTMFLHKGKGKTENQYNNYRVVPDKDGIRSILQGGSTSPK